MTQSPALSAVYQRIFTLQQRTYELPDSQQAILATALEEIHALLEELQASESELHAQNETLLNTREAVEAERQRYQELFEFAPDGYLVTDINGRIQEANCAIAALLKVSKSFLVDKPLLVFIDQPDRSQFHLKLDQLPQVETVQDWQIRLRSLQRSPFDASLTVAVVRNAAGQTLGLRWLLRDITESKQVARLLENLNLELERQVQERTARLQESLSFEAVLKRITDKVRDSLDEHQILQTAVQELFGVLNLLCCNTALYDLELGTATVQYQVSAQEHCAISPLPVGHMTTMTDIPENYHQLLQGEYFQFCELRSDFPCNWTILACPIMDERSVLGDLRLLKPSQDVFSETEISLVQQVANQCAIALRQARLFQASQMQIQEMKKLDQLKDNFLSTTSHELRSPVATMRIAIRMLKSALLQERAAETEGIKAAKSNATDRYLHILNTECEREINLINNLLDLQRFEAGEHPLSLEPIQLQDWLPPVVFPFQERARDRQQTLQIQIPHPLPVLQSDAATLERILSELLNNACKYTSQSGQISITVQTQDSWMQIQVSNTSEEISANELEHLFDKFYRIPNSNPWKEGGTGLGLALAQKLLESLNGQISAAWTSGKLHLTVQLPLFNPFS